MDGKTGLRDGYLEKETRFGAYSVVLRSGNDLNESLRQGLGLTGGDSYLEVHVPDSVKGTPRGVLGAFKDGAVELADYLIERRLSPRCLIGVTHQNVAMPARRFLNFQVLPGIPGDAVDKEKAKRIDRGYSETKRAKGGVARGPLCLCYQSYEAFLHFTETLRHRRGR
ncbi:MAG: hypothetical protein WD379_06025 [Dehalococcoidia bacterium]